jgi:hypothetical protein
LSAEIPSKLSPKRAHQEVSSLLIAGTNSDRAMQGVGESLQLPPKLLAVAWSTPVATPCAPERRLGRCHTSAKCHRGGEHENQLRATTEG